MVTRNFGHRSIFDNFCIFPEFYKISTYYFKMKTRNNVVEKPLKVLFWGFICLFVWFCLFRFLSS